MARKSRKNTEQPEVAEQKPVFYATYGYARLSNDSDTAECSIENQSAIIREFVKGRPELELVDIISDVGFTGTNTDRPGFIELLAKIKCGDVQCLVCKDLSRVGRQHLDVGEFLFDTLPAYGVRFLSISDNYDSFADDASRKKLLILFKNLINHMYSLDLGKKIRSAHDIKKSNGLPIGSAAFGYRINPETKEYEIDEDAATTVRTLFEMRLSGMSVCAIAKHLNQIGLPTPQNRRYQLGLSSEECFARQIIWQSTTVRRILSNEIYEGTFAYNKSRYSNGKSKKLPKTQWERRLNNHPAIVSHEQFDAVQRLLSEASESVNPEKVGPTSDNRYAGKLFCSSCGRKFHRYGSKYKGGALLYYRCATCDEALKATTGKTRTPKISSETLDAVLSAMIRKHIALFVDVERLLDTCAKADPFAAKRAELSREKSRLEKSAGEADRTLSAAYTHHLDGLLDFKEFELVRAKVDFEKRQTATRLSAVEAELKKYDVRVTHNNEWLKHYEAFRDFDKPSREMILALVKRIYVTPITNEVQIELNYMDAFAELKALADESGVGRDD